MCSEFCVFVSWAKAHQEPHTTLLWMWPECVLNVLWMCSKRCVLCFNVRKNTTTTHNFAANVLWLCSACALNLMFLCLRVQKHTNNHIQLRCECALTVLWVLFLFTCANAHQKPHTTSLWLWHECDLNVLWMCSKHCALLACAKAHQPTNEPPNQQTTSQPTNQPTSQPTN